MQNFGIRFGLIGGVVVIIYFAAMYAAGKALFLNPAVQWGSLFIYALFMFLSARSSRDANSADQDFRTLVREPFLTFVIMNLLYWMFYYGLHLADPSLVQLELDAKIADMRAQLEAGTGDPSLSAQLREQITELENMPPVQPLDPVLLQFAFGTLGGFAMSAAIVALIRKR